MTFTRMSDLPVPESWEVASDFLGPETRLKLDKEGMRKVAELCASTDADGAAVGLEAWKDSPSPGLMLCARIFSLNTYGSAAMKCVHQAAVMVYPGKSPGPAAATNRHKHANAGSLALSVIELLQTKGPNPQEWLDPRTFDQVDQQLHASKEHLWRTREARNVWRYADLLRFPEQADARARATGIVIDAQLALLDATAQLLQCFHRSHHYRQQAGVHAAEAAADTLAAAMRWKGEDYSIPGIPEPSGYRPLDAVIAEAHRVREKYEEWLELKKRDSKFAYMPSVLDGSPLWPHERLAALSTLANRLASRRRLAKFLADEIPLPGAYPAFKDPDMLAPLL